MKKFLLKMCIWSVTFFKCETWTIYLMEKNRLETVVLLKNVKIPLNKRMTIEEVIDKIKEKRPLWKCIKSRSDKIIGHILGQDSLLKAIIERDVKGHVEKGRPKQKT